MLLTPARFRGPSAKFGRRIESANDTQGNAYLFTSYDATTSGNIVNQVKREFNGLGQIIKEWQSHSGAVSGSSKKVEYTYSEMASGANHSRLTTMVYPDGFTLTYNYASGLNNNISRLTSITDASNTLESYEYLGLGIVVKRGHAQSGVDLTYIKQTGESDGDAGDKYIGLDRFYRIVDHRNRSSSADVDRFQYGYDRDNNRLWRENVVNTAFGEFYVYDSLNQLISMDRGTLNGTKTGLTGAASRAQDWDYDALGNWDSVISDGSTQTRGHNKQNEITSISGLTTPTYDANGNLTTDQSGKTFKYDSWNRLTEVKTSVGSTIVAYKLDALNRRVSETKGSDTRDFYYSTSWQVVEESLNGTAVARNVWSPVYIDALILRDRDSDANGSLDERLYAIQDANFNITALVNTSGVVVERYAYDSYGQATVYDGSWTLRSGGSAYAWVYLHQGLRFDGDVMKYENRGRVYDPVIGRFIQVDPIGFVGGDLNWYRSLNNRPTYFLDPSGLRFIVRPTLPPVASPPPPRPSTTSPRMPLFNPNQQFHLPDYLNPPLNRSPHGEIGPKNPRPSPRRDYLGYSPVQEIIELERGYLRDPMIQVRIQELLDSLAPEEKVELEEERTIERIKPIEGPFPPVADDYPFPPRKPRDRKYCHAKYLECMDSDLGTAFVRVRKESACQSCYTNCKIQAAKGDPYPWRDFVGFGGTCIKCEWWTIPQK